MKELKSLGKFETVKLEKSKFKAVKGGCTCGSHSMCHMDGTDEGDSVMK